MGPWESVPGSAGSGRGRSAGEVGFVEAEVARGVGPGELELELGRRGRGLQGDAHRGVGADRADVGELEVLRRDQRAAVERGAVDRDGEMLGRGLAVVADRQIAPDRDFLLDEGVQPGPLGFALAGAAGGLLEPAAAAPRGSGCGAGRSGRVRRRCRPAPGRRPRPTKPPSRRRSRPSQPIHPRQTPSARFMIAASSDHDSASGPYWHGRSGQTTPGFARFSADRAGKPGESAPGNRVVGDPRPPGQSALAAGSSLQAASPDAVAGAEAFAGRRATVRMPASLQAPR